MDFKIKRLVKLMSRKNDLYESFNLSSFLEFVKANKDDIKKKKSKKLFKKEDVKNGKIDSKRST